MEREQDETKVEAHVRRLGHHPAEKGELLEILPGGATVMHAIGDAGIAQLISQPRLLQHLPEASLHVVPLRKLRPYHQPELDVGHGLLPLCAAYVSAL